MKIETTSWELIRQKLQIENVGIKMNIHVGEAYFLISFHDFSVRLPVNHHLWRYLKHLCEIAHVNTEDGISVEESLKGKTVIVEYIDTGVKLRVFNLVDADNPKNYINVAYLF